MPTPRHVLSIGFHPDVPGPLGPTEVQQGLDAAKAQLDGLGLPTDLCFVMNAEGDTEIVASALRAKPYAFVCVGAGVRLAPQHTALFERVINVIHRLAPQATLCFNVNPADTANAVRRWSERS